MIPARSTPRVHLTLRVDPSIVARLDALAAKHGCTRSDAHRALLDGAIERAEVAEPRGEHAFDVPGTERVYSRPGESMNDFVARIARERRWA